MKQMITYYTFPDTIQGGHSGLAFSGKNDQGELLFWTHTDRGPNADEIKNFHGNLQARPFLHPGYRPKLIQFALDLEAKSIRLVQEIGLTLPNGAPMSGLPNLLPKKDRTGDELPVNLAGKPLPLDPMGIDPEAICFTAESIWLSEEYGPSILQFDLKGKLQKRFVPQGYFTTQEFKILEKKFPGVVVQSLPEKLLRRKLNRGFEGLTCQDSQIYALLQSPLPDEGLNVSMIQFDLMNQRMVKEYKYPLDSIKADKIGDISFLEKKLLVIEQNSETGPESIHKIFAVQLSSPQLEKELYVDLVALGMDFSDKIEGLATMSENQIAVLNDNDFSLTGKVQSSRAEKDPKKKSILAIIDLQ
jgi:hypothetical protein